MHCTIHRIFIEHLTWSLRPRTSTDSNRNPVPSSSPSQDPEVLVTLGDVDCTMGFLPWQIRLTEIHPLRNWESAKPADLVNVLRAYSRCQQRFGT